MTNQLVETVVKDDVLASMFGGHDKMHPVPGPLLQPN
jgi:hypothetical protein